MYQHGLFAFSGDPITLGHLHLIERIAKKCKRLTVVIATSDTKTPLFTIQERYQLANRVLDRTRFPNVHVIWSTDVLGNIFLDLDCDVLFRGIRGDKDRMEERELIGTYIAVWPFLRDAIEIVEANDGFRHISSTMARVCAARHLPLEGLVPLSVKRALEERVAKQYKLGVTGRMATGKTWLANSLADSAMRKGIGVSVISFDQLILNAYTADSPGGAALQRAIAQFFGSDVVVEGVVNTKALAAKLFSPELPRERFNDFIALTRPYVNREYQRALVGKTGLIIIEWSQMIEMQMTQMVNNNVIHVTAASSDHEAFVKKRGIDDVILRHRLAHQIHPTDLQNALSDRIWHDGEGHLFPFVNAYVPIIVDQILEQEILPYFPGLEGISL